ncbi:MAG: phage integrase SAM-like domain-containing protein [Mucilaginibacter sp.]
MHRKTLYENLKIGSIRRCDGVISKLSKFCKAEPLFFDEINMQFIQRFQQYLRNELHNQANTIHSNLKVIRK